MEYKIKRTLLLMACLLTSMAGWAEGVVTAPGVGSYLHIGGIAYKVTSTDPRTVSVTNKYNSLTQSGIQKTYTGSVVIPETITYSVDGVGSWSYTVTGIDDNAFEYGSSMTALTIPKTVTSVSTSAFTNATGLASLTICDGERNLSISLPNSPLTQLYLGRNITNYGAFKGATNLTLTVGDNITDLKDGLFAGATNLKSIALPECLASIGKSFFYNCNALITVNIPGNMTEIKAYTFQNCKSLKSVHIPNNITAIRYQAFSGCDNLKDFIIEDGNSRIALGDYSLSPFSNNCSIDSLYLGRNLYSNYQYGVLTNLTKVAIGDEVTDILEKMFYCCGNLINVHFGRNISSMGEYAFCGCTSLEHIDLKSQLTELSGGAFSSCNALKTVVWPEGLTTIYNNVFMDCSSLQSISIPNSVTTIHNSAFSGCDNLKTFIIEDGENALSLGGGNTYATIFSDNYCPVDSLYLGRKMYQPLRATNLTKLTIGNKVTSLSGSSWGELFGTCTLLSRIYPLWENPITFDKSVFPSSVYTNATLLVPGGTVKNYQATSAWNEFANIVPTSIGVRMTATAGGSVILGDVTVTNGTQLIQVKPNSVLTFEIAAEDEYYLKSVTLNGEDVTAQVVDGQFTPSDFSEDIELTVTFAPKPYYSVTATATGGGTATVAAESVMMGRSTTVTLAPDEGHELVSVTVNGTDRTNEVVDGVLTLSNIQENMTVAATFQKLRYALTALECENGSIELSATEVEWGDDVTVTLVTDAHYETATVSVNGEDRTAELENNQLTIQNIRQNITVGATFRLETFTVSVTSNEGGTVSLSDDAPAWGSSVIVTVTPDNGYEIVSVTVDGEDVTALLANSQYTIASVEHDMAVEAVFRLITEATIRLSSYGESTYCSDHDLDFSGVQGLKAYIASGYYPQSGYVLLTRVTEVPAGTGIMVKGEAGTYKVPYSESDAYYVNMFVGNVEPTVIDPTDGNYSNFYLTTGSSGFGFYRVTKTRTMSANRAYLQLPTSLVANESRIGLAFEDEVQGIVDLQAEDLRLDSKVVYDLQGRKIANGKSVNSKSPKGLYIKNGKKVIINK